MSFHSSDEDYGTSSLQPEGVFYDLAKKRGKMVLVTASDSSDSDPEDLAIITDGVVPKPMAKRTESYSTTV